MSHKTMHALGSILLVCVLVQMHSFQVHLDKVLNNMLQARWQLASAGGAPEVLGKVCAAFHSIQLEKQGVCTIYVHHFEHWVDGCEVFLEKSDSPRLRWWWIRCEISFVPKAFPTAMGTRSLELKFKL